MKANTLSTLLLLASLAAAGCGTTGSPPCDCSTGQCDGASSCDASAPSEEVCRELLARFELDPRCGVFVESFNGDDQNAGTFDAPLRTLSRAIALARTGRHRVFMAGRYDETVVLPSGVDLWGTFKMMFAWDGTGRILPWVHTRKPGDVPKVGLSPRGVGPIPITVVPAAADDDSDGISTIADIDAEAGPLDSDILSRFAMVVQPGAAVEVVRAALVGDPGHGGDRGADGPAVPADDGPSGNFGVAVCTEALAHGGAAVTKLCDGVATTGGKGGDGLSSAGGNGEDGSPVPVPNPGGWGRGGAADTGNGGCEAGVDGRMGELGENGTPGSGVGRFIDGRYDPTTLKGGDGGKGKPGQGGGGGGGAPGGAAYCGIRPPGGASGGSGGAGGCGSQGGKGGTGGHASIGILALRGSKVTVKDSVIETKRGGQGGPGGKPQDAGYGGYGATGQPDPNQMRYGCRGGRGGDGGMGGYGGGGGGGPSIGIVYFEEGQLSLENVTFKIGPGGKGGRSDSADPTTWGADGIARETFRFPE